MKKARLCPAKGFHKKRQGRSLFLLLLLCLLLSGCGSAKEAEPVTEGASLTDAFGSVTLLPSGPRVVSCYASFAECWLLSGGELAGVTRDAVEERGLSVGEAKTVGTVKHIQLEELAALSPDYVILSGDLSAHLALRDSLEAMGIPHGYFRVDDFADYKALMEQFCAINGGDELFRTHVLDVEEEIEAVKDRVGNCSGTYLLLRVYSTGMKAKGDDNLAGQILDEFGLRNIARGTPALTDGMSQELSLEYIVESDPDYIFALSMGSEEGGRQYLAGLAAENPVWESLTAVREGRFHMLPKELFHYKPNHRWGESYGYLAELIAPEAWDG